MYKIFLVVDNDSWILPYVEKLRARLEQNGNIVTFARSYDEIECCDIVFYLGCISIAPSNILGLADRNLVVHESSLPNGKGFSPMSWQILEGLNTIPVCLCEAADKVDSGDIVYLDYIQLSGNELHDEWRELQGNKTIELCERFASSSPLPKGTAQMGVETYYSRRTPNDSMLDINRSLLSQFNLLRVSSNENYPAYFMHNGDKYILKVYKEK